MLPMGKYLRIFAHIFNEIITIFTMLWKRFKSPAQRVSYRGTALAVGQSLALQAELATLLGVNEALILQKFHEWIEYNQWSNKQDHFVAGRWWTYNTYKSWQADHFMWLSVSSIKRICLKLENMGILVSQRMDESKRNQTKWYSIDYQKLSALLSAEGTKRVPSGSQVKPLSVSKESTDSNSKASRNSLKPQKEKASTPNTARAQITDVDGGSIPDSGDDHFSQDTEGTDRTPVFEEKQHEADAAENPLPVPRGFPLSPAVQRLVDEHALNPATAAAYLEKHGAEHCERVAEVARKGHTPAGLWRDLLDKGDYRHVHKKSAVPGKIDDFIIK